MSWEAIIAGLTLVWLVGGGIISYWVNSISKSQDSLSKNQSDLARDLKNFELKVTDEYAKKIDINTRLDKIDDILAKIFDRLDQKADKNV
jgi:hypothetical protein